MSDFKIDVTGRRGIHEKLSQNDDPFNCPSDKTVVISVEDSVPEDTKLAFTEGQYVAPAVVQTPSPAPTVNQTPAPEPEVEEEENNAEQEVDA